jgi:hypothetical protein
MVLTRFSAPEPVEKVGHVDVADALSGVVDVDRED